MKVEESTSPSKKLTPRATKDLRRREHLLFLTLQELELMRIIWERGEASVAQVRKIYQSERNLAYTTIMTFLSRLKEKGMLKQRKVGKAFYYSPLHSREEVADAAIDNLARIFFKESRESLANFCRGVPPSPPRRAEEKPLKENIDETLL